MGNNAYKIADELLSLAPIFRKKVLNSVEDFTKGKLTHTQLLTLIMIYHQPNMTMGQLANELMVSKQQLTNIVNVLEKETYVERSISEHNRRNVMLNITARGAEKCQEIRNCVIETQKRIIPNMSEEKYKECIEAIHVIRDLLESE